MKILCVAHPDDEVIWFNPDQFELIIIVFGQRLDKPSMNISRQRVMDEHPLKNKILFLNLMESGYWKNKEKLKEHQENYFQLLEVLQSLGSIWKECTEIFTHNSNGEYGHSDHILVHDAIKQYLHDNLGLPVWMNSLIKNDQHKEIETDFAMFNVLRALYVKHQAWTWSLDYRPNASRYYQRIGEQDE